VTNVDFTSPQLSAGGHNIGIFYADRENTGAFLSLTLLSTDVVISPGVPETSTWAMMLLGFAGLGFMAYRRKSRLALMAA
jgi:hypothetical protein